MNRLSASRNQSPITQPYLGTLNWIMPSHCACRKDLVYINLKMRGEILFVLNVSVEKMFG